MTVAGARLLRSGSPRRSPIRRRSRAGSTRSRCFAGDALLRGGHPRAARGGARPRPRARPAGARPRRPARPRRDPRRPRAAAGARRAARRGAELPAEIARRSAALRRPDPAIAAELGGGARRRAAAVQARRRLRARRATTPTLDEARALRDESRRVVAALQARYADETGVRVAEDPPQQRARLFRRGHRPARRAAAGARRSTRPSSTARRWPARCASPPTELGELEAKIAERRRPRAGHRARDLRARSPRAWSAAADAIQARRRGARGARRRGGASPTLAVERGYVRPEVDALARLRHRGRAPSGGRAGARARDGEPFVANDCDLSPPTARGGAGRIWLVTGPNMAGKSTFLRQNALIAVLAQMGSFVPAKRARIGVVDRLFSRVGAADDLARGRSTFMVEMVETAAILNQATRALARHPRRDRPRHRDLRRPSIAWAAIEHLHEQNRCRALFATHFHELTALAAQAAARCSTPPCGSRNGRATSCSCTRSCPAPPTAPTASRWRSSPACPAKVIERAKLVLAELEAEDRTSPARRSRRSAAVRAARAAATRRRADPAADAVMRRSPRSIPTRCRRARRWKRSTPSSSWRSRRIERGRARCMAGAAERKKIDAIDGNRNRKRAQERERCAERHRGEMQA